MRLASHLVAGLGVLLLVLAGARRYGLLAGLVAGGAFILLPHVWFHAQLHTFDVPVAVAILAVVLAWIRGRTEPRLAWACGVLLGIAVATKHNGLFVGPLLLAHHVGELTARSWRTGARPKLREIFPTRVVALLTVAPMIFVGSWPWLWRDPWSRSLEWAVFHRDHAYYNTEFFGANFNEPPLPMSYPFVMTWATVPTTLLVLAVVGFTTSRPRASLETASRAVVEPAVGSSEGEWSLLLSFAIFPLLLIAHPSVPIFGGTKHWLTAYPFMALAVAAGWARCVSILQRLWDVGPIERMGLAAVRLALPSLLAVLVLLPSAVTTRRGHPHLLSQYAPLVAARGAATLGLQRGFWGYDMLSLLQTADSIAPPRRALDAHDLHPLARLQLQREGRWPTDWNPSPLARAGLALHFYERHTQLHEVEIWNALGTTRPRQVVTLDDVPLTSLYTRE